MSLTVHLPAHSQEETSITLSCMTWDTKSFWEFQITMQSENALLKGTHHHFDDTKICEHIKASMNQVCTCKPPTQCKDIVNFCAWLAEVKRVDNKKHFKHDQAGKAFEQSMASTCTAYHMNNLQNFTHGNTLSGPSHKANATSGFCLQFQKYQQYWH